MAGCNSTAEQINTIPHLNIATDRSKHPETTVRFHNSPVHIPDCAEDQTLSYPSTCDRFGFSRKGFLFVVCLLGF